MLVYQETTNEQDGIAEMRRSRWICGKVRRDKIRNKTVCDMVGGTYKGEVERK